MFRRDFEERRCLIPAGKFYEWKKIGVKQKEKYEFFAPDEILYLAGIYHKDPTGDRFTILTRDRASSMRGFKVSEEKAFVAITAQVLFG